MAARGYQETEGEPQMPSRHIPLQRFLWQAGGLSGKRTSLILLLITNAHHHAERTSKNASVALASRSIFCRASSPGRAQGASAPPLKRLKYPPSSFAQASISGT